MINQYNKDNRWKKKGISVNPLKWGINWSAGNYNVLISIYAADGSVQLAHGGIEIGQGIHTGITSIICCCQFINYIFSSSCRSGLCLCT